MEVVHISVAVEVVIAAQYILVVWIVFVAVGFFVQFACFAAAVGVAVLQACSSVVVFAAIAFSVQFASVESTAVAVLASVANSVAVLQLASFEFVVKLVQLVKFVPLPLSVVASAVPVVWDFVVVVRQQFVGDTGLA